MQFGGKLIWVIGGAGYLGQAIVGLLNQYGARIVCMDIGNKAKEFVEVSRLDRVEPVTVDINNTEMLACFVKEMVSRFGVPDGLVNLAFGSTAKSLEELTDTEFDQVNHAALTATFILSREVSAYMIKNGGGSMVLFSSMYGMVSPDESVYEAPMNKNPIEYGVGKAGVIQMTKYLSVHWARQGVRVNCISPGPFPNPTVQKNYPEFVDRLRKKSPMDRVGEAEEIAGPVAFLLSDLSSYVNGHNLVVDGGWTSW